MMHRAPDEHRPTEAQPPRVPPPASERDQSAVWAMRWLPTILTAAMLAVVIVAGFATRAERREADAAAAATSCREHQMMLLHVDLFERIDRHEGQPAAAAIALAEWRRDDAPRYLANVKRC